MPHLMLEYTSNVPPINFNQLFAQLHQLLADEAGISCAKFKSRAVQREDYHVGDGDEQHAFVHLEIALFTGRPEALKDRIGQKTLEMLHGYYPSAGGLLQLTVEIREFSRANYFKA